MRREPMNEKILHLRSSGGFYGAEQVILTLARELSALGCSNHIVCFNNTYHPHLELLEAATKSHLSAVAVDCRGVFDTQTVKSIRQILTSRAIDVIHCHDYKTRFFGLCAARGLNLKKVATNHLWTHANLRLRVYEAIDGMLLNAFDKVVAVSEPIEMECRRFMLRTDKLTCIPNGIDTSRFAISNRDEQRRITREELGFKPDDLVIGNIARLSIEKDQALLLRAFKELASLSRERSYKLLLVGNGPEERQLRNLATELGIHDRCLFAGVRRDVPQILTCLDVYVQSSRREGLPMIVLEAMAAKVAIVATKAGGIPKVIVDGKDGRLVDIGDADHLARVLHDLLNRADERTRLGQEAHRVVEAQFGAHAMAERYLAVYRSLMDHA
jgi:glycosyltransferase involved in cell wall biosynthesis